MTMPKIRWTSRTRTTEDWVIDTLVYTVVGLLCLLTLVPFLQVVTISVSPSEVASRDGLHLIPLAFDGTGYAKVFSNPLIWISYWNTIVRVVLGTVLTLTLLLLAAYALSKDYLPHRKLWTTFLVFTMYFSGGLIPTYFIVTGLKLYNTLWALILPTAVNVFALIVMRNFIAAIPASLVESARIDGCHELRILWSVIVPLSGPIIATVGIWSILYHWNEWFNCLLYTQDEVGYVLQLVLRRILLEGEAMDNLAGDNAVAAVNTDATKMAVLVVSVVPIIIAYMFLQKFFMKGTTLGAVKG